MPYPGWAAASLAATEAVHRGADLLEPVIERPGAGDAAGQCGVASPRPAPEPFAVVALLARTESELADHGDHVGGHPGVEPEPPVGSPHHVRDEELTDGVEKLRRPTGVVQR